MRNAALRLQNSLTHYAWFQSVGMMDNTLVIYTSCEVDYDFPQTWENYPVIIQVLGKIN